VAAWAYQAEDARRRHESGLAAAALAEKATFETMKVARDAVIKAPARTLADIRLKVAVLLSFFDGLADLENEIARSEYAADGQLALSIARDLAKLPKT
jgi:phage shock protein A